MGHKFKPSGVLDFGLTAVPRDVNKLLPAPGKPCHTPTPTTPETTPIPTTKLARLAHAYAREVLPGHIFNHSMRVYHYGITIQSQQFPDWNWNDTTVETYFLTCMLHDCGLTVEKLHSTRLSFEFWGGYNAINVLHHNKLFNGDLEQAESVAEAIIRHNDFAPIGFHSQNGLLLQLATTFDNLGEHSFMVHPETIEHVVKAFPRLHWNTYVPVALKYEYGLKPWSLFTKFEDVDKVGETFAYNKVMEQYDDYGPPPETYNGETCN